MSLHQDKVRKLTQKEIDYWEDLATRIMSESVHWRQYYFMRRDLRAAIERQILSPEDLRYLQEDLREWCN